MLDIKGEILTGSWLRCSRKEVKKSNTAITKTIAEEDLKCKICENEKLIKIFNKITENLIRKFSLHKCIFTLVDKKTYVLAVNYPQKSDNDLIKINVGDCLAEESCGTNAVALCVKEKEEFFLKGEDHYCQLFHNYLSFALPIKVIGRIKGFLGIFIYRKKVRQNYWGLISELIAKYIAGEFIKKTYFTKGRNRELNETQKEILKLSAQGYKISEIKKIMDINESSVKYHRCQIYKKLEVENIVHALGEAIKNGIITVDEI